jgi:hypothetical protein
MEISLQLRTRRNTVLSRATNEIAKVGADQNLRNAALRETITRLGSISTCSKLAGQVKDDLEVADKLLLMISSIQQTCNCRRDPWA